jgi:hypothetical protein
MWYQIVIYVVSANNCRALENIVNSCLETYPLIFGLVQGDLNCGGNRPYRFVVSIRITFYRASSKSGAGTKPKGLLDHLDVSPFTPDLSFAGTSPSRR